MMHVICRTAVVIRLCVCVCVCAWVPAGGLCVGPVADKSGRRAALAATTVPLAVGTVISALSNSFWTMMLGRDLVDDARPSSRVVEHQHHSPNN